MLLIIELIKLMVYVTVYQLNFEKIWVIYLKNHLIDVVVYSIVNSCIKTMHAGMH